MWYVYYIKMIKTIWNYTEGLLIQMPCGADMESLSFIINDVLILCTILARGLDGMVYGTSIQSIKAMK